jgi:outer membrane protein
MMWKRRRFLATALVFTGMALPDFAQNIPSPPPTSAAVPAQQPAIQSLTLQDAERIAIQNHPQIQIAQHQAAFAKEQVTESQSAYYPQAVDNATGVLTETGSRLSAGGLNSPRAFDKFADGVSVTQLITDFGRTHDLVKSANLHSQAQQENIVTSRADVLLQVDEAYFGVLKSQSLLTVAQETVKDRQVVSDQVTTLAQNQLRSGLDVAFANVDLAQAKLLLIQAQNDVQASFAQLSMALGYAAPRTFQVMEIPTPPAPPGDFTQVLQQAIQNRPELISLRLDVNSAQTYLTAERDLWFPTLNGAGAAGLSPWNAPQQTAELGSRYSAAGFNLQIPIFNGHLFSALRAQANEQYLTQQQSLRNLQDTIARDVRTAWLNAQSGYQRLAVTEQLLNEATQANNLAEARYRIGLSSIVELTQSQLNLTQAQIEEASAKYEYEAQTSTLNFQTGVLH